MCEKKQRASVAAHLKIKRKKRKKGLKKWWYAYTRKLQPNYWLWNCRTNEAPPLVGDRPAEGAAATAVIALNVANPRLFSSFFF